MHVWGPSRTELNEEITIPQNAQNGEQKTKPLPKPRFLLLLEAMDSKNNMVLRNDDILANVCQFVGSGHFFFVANVNTKFRDAYKHYLTSGSDDGNDRFVTTADSIAVSICRAYPEQCCSTQPGYQLHTTTERRR